MICFFLSETRTERLECSFIAVIASAAVWNWSSITTSGWRICETANDNKDLVFLFFSLVNVLQYDKDYLRMYLLDFKVLFYISELSNCRIIMQRQCLLTRKTPYYVCIMLLLSVILYPFHIHEKSKTSRRSTYDSMWYRHSCGSLLFRSYVSRLWGTGYCWIGSILSFLALGFFLMLFYMKLVDR